MSNEREIVRKISDKIKDVNVKNMVKSNSVDDISLNDYKFKSDYVSVPLFNSEGKPTV